MDFRKIILFVFSAAVALGALGVSSFPQSLPLKHYFAKDGLPSSFVTCIRQDSLGYLWFGTEDGLCRFNGRGFQNFLDEKHGLKNDYIMDLYEDYRGNLWIATRGAGLVCMNLNSNVITAYTANNGLPSNRVSSIAEDPNGNLWLGTHSGLCMFDGKTFSVYTTKNGLIDNYINDILFDRLGDLWIGSGKGLSCLKRNNKKEKKHFVNYTTNNGLINDWINTLTLDHKGNIWIGAKGGLSRLQNEKKKTVFISYSSRDGMINDYVKTIIEDRNKNLWIGTDNGVSYFSSGKFTNFNSKKGFPNDTFLSIFEDKEGNTWFGTTNGATRLHSLRIINFSVNDGLPDNIIWAILEENPGKYWIGTNKGLCCYSGGKIKTYTKEDDGLISDTVYSLLKDRMGNIWIATDIGLSVYSLINGRFTNYTVKDGLPYEVVLSLEEDRNGTIWIGTMKGLCRFIDGKIVPHGFNVELEPLAIQTILIDRKENFWFSDTKRLWRIQGGKVIHYSTQEGLIGDYIYSLMEDSRGRIWIGTKRGLSCFDNGKFTNYSKDNGLSDDSCLFLLEDDRHNIWIGAQKGLNRYDGKSFKTYTSRDGLIADEMNHCTSLKDSRGDLWLGTKNGISRFTPGLDRRNTIPPPTTITQFQVMEEDRPIIDNISLKTEENYIKFSFVGICYTSPEDVTYKYCLEGADRKWFENKDGYISYPSLPPGNYVFKVLAKNNDGVESIKPAKFRFRILPPFWKTWWFNMLAILLLVFIAAQIIRFQNKRVKEKMANEATNKQLVMAQRMKLLGVLAGGAVHDLKNLLTIIIGYSDLVHDLSLEASEEEKNEAIEIIKSTADTAFQVVKHILTFARQNYNETKVSELSDLLNEILSILKITIPRTMDILWDPPAEKMHLSINPVKFKQVVMNLCLNAVHAMGEEGQLKISLSKDTAIPLQIVIEVSDTGPGIKQEYLDKIFEPLFTTKGEEKGSGLGLFVVKQIVDEYNGKIEVQSKPGEGATFKIYFPYVESVERVNNEEKN